MLNETNYTFKEVVLCMPGAVSLDDIIRRCYTVHSTSTSRHVSRTVTRLPRN